MKQLDAYNEALHSIFDYFGLDTSWEVVPIEDDREYFWKLNPDESQVFFFDDKEIIEKECDDSTAECFSNDIYIVKGCPKHIFVGKEHTLIVTVFGAYKALAIFDNKKQIK